jgi:hypothetical protein
VLINSIEHDSLFGRAGVPAIRKFDKKTRQSLRSTRYSWSGTVLVCKRRGDATSEEGGKVAAALLIDDSKNKAMRRPSWMMVVACIATCCLGYALGISCSS